MMKNTIDKSQRIKDLIILAFTGLTAFVAFFSEKEFDSTNFLWIKHILQCLKPEIFILLILILVVRFRKFIGALFVQKYDDSNDKLIQEKKLGSLVLIVLFLFFLFGMFLSFDSSLNLVKNRVVYWRDHIPGSLRKELIHYARFYESNGQLNKSKRFYSIVLDKFPFTDNTYVTDKLNLINRKLDFSTLYYRKAGINENTSGFTRDQFGLLATSLKINPEDDNVFNLLDVTCDYLLSFKPRVEEFYVFVRNNNEEEIDRYLNEYSWLIMGSPDIPFYEAKSKYGWSTNKIRSFMKAFDKEEYVKYVYSTWNIENAKKIVQWAREKKITSQNVPKLDFMQK